MKVFIFLSVLMFIGCSHKRTAYQAYKKQEGYKERTENGHRIINFRANSNTKEKVAQEFASFRAVEICLGEGKKVTHIMDVLDKTDRKNVIRTSGNTFYPSYYYGMSPFYSRYSSIGFSTVIGNTSSIWQETVVTPEFEVIYDCVDQVWGPEIIFKEVSPEQMKLLVKDLKGGLQIEKILEDSPNKTKLKDGDIILKGNDIRLEQSLELVKYFNSIPPRNKMKVELLREGEKMTAWMEAKEITGSVLESQNRIINAACEYEEIKEKKICTDRK